MEFSPHLFPPVDSDPLDRVFVCETIEIVPGPGGIRKPRDELLDPFDQDSKDFIIFNEKTRSVNFLFSVLLCGCLDLSSNKKSKRGVFFLFVFENLFHVVSVRIVNPVCLPNELINHFLQLHIETCVQFV